MNQKTKKFLLLNLPYVIIGLFCTNVGEAWRIATGADLGTKIISFCGSMGAVPKTLPLLRTPCLKTMSF